MRELFFCLSIAFLLISSEGWAAKGFKSACDIDKPPADCSSMLVVTSEALVGKTGVPANTPDPKCATQNSTSTIESAIKVIVAYYQGDLSNSAGDIRRLLTDAKFGQTLLNNTGGVVHQFILNNGLKTEFANCVTLAVVVPDSADVLGYRVRNVDIDASLEDPARFGGCSPGVDCSNGWSRLLSYPSPVKVDGVQYVSAVFANWSHDRRRVGELYVFFKLPPGEEVLEEL